jgi:putative phosphoribosyl transferase
VLAVPVAPANTLAALSGEVDRIVCLMQPDPFRTVGVHYVDFHQVSDEEVIAALQ